jgi:bacillithiol system protein YtxJ
MNWKFLTTEEEIQKIIGESETKPALIFKYSGRCSICDRVQDILEADWSENESANEEKIVPYFLDLIRYRNVSNAVARKFNVMHESPQVLVIKNGKVVYTESHGYIRFEDILKSIN